MAGNRSRHYIYRNGGNRERRRAREENHHLGEIERNGVVC